MPLWLWVALGSAVGGVARYAVARLWPTVPAGWPLATMTAYVVATVVLCLAAALAGRALGPG